MSHRVIRVDEELINYCMSDPTQPEMVIMRIHDQPDHPLYSKIQIALMSIPEEKVTARLTDPQWHWYYSNPDSGQTRMQVRRELLTIELNDLVYQSRKEALCQVSGTVRPYDHPSFKGIEPDQDWLVPIDVFEIEHLGIFRNDYAFNIPPTLPATNSSYWLMQHLMRMKTSSRLKIRPDPFIVCKRNKYNPAFYKMWVYGQQLDWDRIARLKEPEHAEWIPDSQCNSVRIGRTQLVWEPRKDGIHFQCEELPDSAGYRPGRYSHAIYNPESENFTHCDCAVRYYTIGEMLDRVAVHLRKAGKIGQRIKIFKIDGNLDRQTWCNLMAAFYVWNEDIQAYFGHPSIFATKAVNT